MVGIRSTAPLLALSLVLPPLARAHIAEFTAALDTAQEVPAPTGTSPSAGGTGTFLLQEDGTIEAMEVTFTGLTGAPILAHIHQGATGVPGPIVVDFTSRLPGGAATTGTITGTGSAALTPAQLTALFSGGMYFNIHTPANRGGEIRGQIFPAPSKCSCDDATAPGRFKSCVKRAIKDVAKDERREDSVKMLRKLVSKSACGKKKTPKKRVACCLPFAPAQNIVLDRLCASVKAKKCERLGGASVGAGIACSPNPCTLNSPAGAFVQASAAD
jgi:hypothetical protein